jgi:hypothetical protein
VLLCRRFAAALTGDRARLEVDVDRYSFIVSDLHRLLIAGLPAHCERFWTLPSASIARESFKIEMMNLGYIRRLVQLGRAAAERQTWHDR